MSLAVLGLGTAVPVEAIDQATASRLAETLCCRTAEHATWLPPMYGNTGIDKRHMVLAGELVDDVLHQTSLSQSAFLPTGQPEDRGPATAARMRKYVECAGPLALAASRQAIDRAGASPRDFTHLVTVSCTGFQAPGVDIELIRGLGLPQTIERTHVGFMGCHGALNGLRVARAFADADPNAQILLCATELCSLHYYYGWDPQKMIANAIFADGSAALVGIGRAPAKNAWRMTASGSCLLPGSTDAMTWSIADHGFQMTLSKKVPGLIAKHLRPWLEAWLRAQGLKLGDIRSWAIHPGGPRILNAVEESLSLPMGSAWASYEVFQQYGNMSSPTVLFIVDRLMRANAERPCVALGFGPGLVAEAALFS